MHRRGLRDAAVGAAITTVILVGGRGLVEPDNRAHDPIRPVLTTAGAVEAHHFGSLAEMTQASDLVVTGSVTKIALSRRWVATEDWGDDGIATYVALTIDVDSTLSGSLDRNSSPVSLEIFVASPKSADELVAGDLPTGRVLLFMDTRTDVEGAYKLASSQGWFMEDDGRFAPVRTDDPWIEELVAEPFDAVVEQVKSIVGST